MMVSVPFTSGSSLQLFLYDLEVDNLEGFSSLYIGILAATPNGRIISKVAETFQFPLHRDPRCNVFAKLVNQDAFRVSVPFTSGSSLQLPVQEQILCRQSVSVPFTSGSSLQLFEGAGSRQGSPGFQFPLHRDPRCNSFCYLLLLLVLMLFQFPLHRDPRCNKRSGVTFDGQYIVSVPFTSGSSLQLMKNSTVSRQNLVSVPFTSGSSLQLGFQKELTCFCIIVSVPFTSGSSLQRWVIVVVTHLKKRVSVPFTSGSSLQLIILTRWHEDDLVFQFPLHRDPRCN